jgi:hypothetical protein
VSARRRITMVRPPKDGVIIRWGRADYGDNPDLVVAWAPGCKPMARVLLDLLDSPEARRALTQAGCARASIRLTAMPADTGAS